jgi:hypothetical protein
MPAWEGLVDVLQKAVADSYDYDLRRGLRASPDPGNSSAIALPASSWRKSGRRVRDDAVDAYKALERLLADEPQQGLVRIRREARGRQRRPSRAARLSRGQIAREGARRSGRDLAHVPRSTTPTRGARCARQL